MQYMARKDLNTYLLSSEEAAVSQEIFDRWSIYRQEKKSKHQCGSSVTKLSLPELNHQAQGGDTLPKHIRPRPNINIHLSKSINPSLDLLDALKVYSPGRTNFMQQPNSYAPLLRGGSRCVASQFTHHPKLRRGAGDTHGLNRESIGGADSGGGEEN